MLCSHVTVVLPYDRPPCCVPWQANWLPCDNHVTTIWQPWGSHVTVRWHVATMSQPCNNHLETMWQPCGNHVTTMWQPCDNHVATMWQPCGNHVTTILKPCVNNLTAMWQPCSNHVSTMRTFVTTLWLSYDNLAIAASQPCVITSQLPCLLQPCGNWQPCSNWQPCGTHVATMLLGAMQDAMCHPCSYIWASRKMQIHSTAKLEQITFSLYRLIPPPSPKVPMFFQLYVL